MEYYRETGAAVSGETWMPIESDIRRYHVSNFGRIAIVRVGRGTRVKKQWLSKKGYCQCSVNGMGQSVHRVVAKAFIPNPLNLPQINHKNGIKTDNRVENLEWCDNLHNQRHARANGLKVEPHGEDHQNSFMTTGAMKALIRLSMTSTLTKPELSRMSGLSISALKDLRAGRSWKHIQNYRNYFE